MGSFQQNLFANSIASHSRSTKDLESNNANEEFVQNVIYAFTGIEGKYFKKDVIVGGLKLDPKVRLNGLKSDTMLRLCEIAYYHDLVESFTDPSSGRSPLGLLGQGLVTAFKHELTLYYGMVAMLQEQVSLKKETEHFRHKTKQNKSSVEQIQSFAGHRRENNAGEN